MNTIDIVLAIFVLITMIIGIKRGFVGSIIHLLAIIVIVLLISKLAPIIIFFLRNQYNLPNIAASIISYFLVIAIIFLVAKIITYFLNKGVKMLSLGFINRFLGAIFGIANGLLILLILVILIRLTPLEDDYLNFTANSKVITELNKIAEKLSTNMPELKKKEVDPIDKLMKKYT